MNSLQKFSEVARKALIAITIISTLTLAASAQRVQPQQQGKMYGEPGFVGEPINLKVVNADIRDILNYITEQYGINFVIDSSVKSVPVTVNVNDVPWNVALDSILSAQGLGVQVNGNILRIADIKILAAEADIRGRQLASQLVLKPLVTQYVRLNYANARNAPSQSQSTSGTTAAGGPNPASGAYSPETGTFVQQDVAKAPAAGEATGLLPIIKRRLSSRGSIEIDDRANALIITDVRENVDAILQLVKVLDQPEPQVEIEARIVVATRNFSRDVGVQLSALVVGAHNSGASGSTLPNAPVDPGINVPPSLPIGSINNGLASQIANTAIGLTTGIFGTAQINMLITAGEQKGQAKIIATPRVTALNNEKAKIESKTQIPITTVQPGSAAGGSVIATTTYVDVPLKLEITPQITDVGTVVLTVLAENSSTSTVVTGATSPAINNQNMQTRVVVPDGGTTVVGGVLFDDERENQDRTPGVSRIPLFGNLFKRKGVQRNTNEILFFITPRIMRADYGNNQPGQSGTVTSFTLAQPVPLGNPPSNSEQKTPVVTNPLVQPEPTPKQQ